MLFIKDEVLQKRKKFITKPIFTEFLKVLVASVGVQGRNVLLFVDMSATSPKDILFLLNLKFVYYLPNCTSMLPSMRTGYC
jgi:hypothetical protein